MLIWVLRAGAGHLGHRRAGRVCGPCPGGPPEGHGGVAWGGVLCSSQKGLQLGGVHTQLPLAACLSNL